jgi:hypothetical protein
VVGVCRQRRQRDRQQARQCVASPCGYPPPTPCRSGAAGPGRRLGEAVVRGGLGGDAGGAQASGW